MLPALYATIRQLVADGAEILIYVHTLGRNPLRANPFAAYEELFPAVDVSTVRFHGNATTALIRKLFFKGTRHFAHRPRASRGHGGDHAPCACPVRLACQLPSRAVGTRANLPPVGRAPSCISW